MKEKNNSKTIILELAGLIALGISLVLILGNLLANQKNQAGQENPYPAPEVVTESSQAYPGPGEKNVSTPTITSIKPPKCIFEHSGLAAEPITSTKNEYTYSEPKVVYSSDSILGVAGWLPDSQRLLITEEKLKRTQNIFTYNITSGEILEYAERSIFSSSSKPFWIEELSAVIYADSSNSTEQLEDKEVLRISYGDPRTATLIDTDIYGASLSSNGKTIAYFSQKTNNQPQVWSIETRTVQALPINVGEWIYPKYSGMILPPASKALWTALHPQVPMIAFYGSWLFLTKITDDKICEIDLIGRDGGNLSIFQTSWSPDGHFLAMVVGELLGGKFFSSYVEILDFTTGQITQPSGEVKYTYDIAWSSDSHSLAIIGEPSLKNNISGDIYIVNILGETTKRITDGRRFGGGIAQNMQLAWSDDNRFIVIKCPRWDETKPLILEDRICIIKVNLQGN